MSDRGCIKCGYILAGLPAAGTLVSCPECGQANDLAVPPPRPRGRFTPVLWGMIPAALGLLFAILAVRFRWMSGNTAEIVHFGGLIIGAITAVVLTFNRFALEPSMGKGPRPSWACLALAACAGVASLILNALIAVAVLHAAS